MSEGLMADQRDYAEEADNRAELEDAAAEAVQQCERLHCTKDMHEICCSSHNKALCHECYRRTHFVEVCVEGCDGCNVEGLAVILLPKS